MGTDYFAHRDELHAQARCTLYTGCIDEFYNYCHGHLDYRSLRFEHKRLNTPDFQGNAVVNYTERQVPYTRVIEHKHFAPGSQQPTTVVTSCTRASRFCSSASVKLLKAYADMDAQPVQGENIQNSKREIEATLDTLNTAFEKLLDSIFKTTALDVSSDISVLNTLLAQEGLTDDELTRLRKEREL